MRRVQLGKHYMHIDNGGLILEAKVLYRETGEYAGAELQIENSFYGYMSNSMVLHVGANANELGAKDLRAMANFLNEMAVKLDNEGKK